mmetsp:Transcript_67857/g.109341  ORF Transcript_67857/g.109341 Transcript_67857/m.109341 type:complete len:240 (-) Transcript_67857:446-1165(-)
MLEVLEVLGHNLWVPKLPRLRQACHTRPTANQRHVVLGRLATECPVHALVVRTFNLEGSQLLLGNSTSDTLEVQRLWVLEGDSLRDQDPIAGLVADVPKVEPWDLHGKSRLEQARRVQLVELHGLLVDGTAESIRRSLLVHRVRNLGKELGVKILRGLQVFHLEEKLAAVIASGDLVLVVRDDLRHPVVFVQRARHVKSLGQELGPKLAAMHHLLGPWELDAIEHARGFLRMVLCHQLD